MERNKTLAASAFGEFDVTAERPLACAKGQRPPILVWPGQTSEHPVKASLSVNLKPVTPDDSAAAIALTPFPEQQHFIATNETSLAEAARNPACRPILIRNGNDASGFAMAALDSDDGNQWIYRFMIDHRFQAMGFGTKALALLISQIFSDTACPRIMLGVKPANVAAIRLYQRAGFRPAGFEFDGEVAFCLDRLGPLVS